MDWNPVHPDTLTGPELDAVVAMFGDIDWHDQTAVEQRAAALTELQPAKRKRNTQP